MQKEETGLNSRKGIEEFLSRPLELEKEIRNDIDHISSLRSIVENTTTKLSLTGGRNPSRKEKAFEAVMMQWWTHSCDNDEIFWESYLNALEEKNY